ncbi:MAG: hypothetical protein ISS71_01480 [Phycisphaerae bacterium]|nr:hypothetical protein [Phycisphaerae bacterium]
MSFLKSIFKELCPPVFYKFIERLHGTRRHHRINSENKFSGKVFCIGFNKTGTTSLEQTLEDFGYHLGNQGVAEMLLSDWYKQDCNRLVRYCYTKQAFQDIPFSLPETYRCLDKAFPDAKFILTVRDSEDQWFQSLIKFHTKLFSSDKSRPPDREDLENALYRYRGFGMDVMKMVYNYPTVSLYNYEYYTKLYRQHNKSVIEYFTDKPDKLLVLNVSQLNAYQNLASFLNVTVSNKNGFPWKNKT